MGRGGRFLGVDEVWGGWVWVLGRGCGVPRVGG